MGKTNWFEDTLQRPCPRVHGHHAGNSGVTVWLLKGSQVQKTVGTQQCLHLPGAVSESQKYLRFERRTHRQFVVRKGKGAHN